MSDQMESVEDFRIRARAWLADNMPKLDPKKEYNTNRVADREWVEHRELQKKLFAGGFAGLCFPKEYGGQGLTLAHQLAFTEESVPYEMPLRLNVPSLSICSGMLLDMGSEEQKQKYLRGAISGEIILCQFLSEPSGGSDLAGLLTRAQRDGDTYVINGQKCWSTYAYAADYATCLVRTDWDAPKHRGLSMIIVPVHDDATHLQRVRMVDGSDEFCEEYFTDLVVPAANLVGTENALHKRSRSITWQFSRLDTGKPCSRSWQRQRRSNTRARGLAERARHRQPPAHQAHHGGYDIG